MIGYHTPRIFLLFRDQSSNSVWHVASKQANVVPARCAAIEGRRQTLFGAAALEEATILSEEHKAVLLVTSGTAKKEGSPKQGWGDTGARRFFNPGRSLEPGVDLLRPVQGVEFLASDAIGFACAWVAIPH